MSRREVRKITQARKDVFLSVLGETGSRAAAAAAASPHTDGGKGLRPGYETFRDLCKRDPEFALAVEQAEAKALGRVEAEIVNRAFTLDERPIFDRQGNRIGTQTSSNASNQMLLRLAERLAPDVWARRSRTELEGHIVHHGAAVAVLEPQDVLLLAEDDQELLLQLISRIEQRKGDVIDVKPQGIPDRS